MREIGELILRLIREGEDAVPAVREEVLALVRAFPALPRRDMNYRILVVEDDAVIAAAVAKHIGAWGCEVRVAENFADVMAEFTAFEPQLVLLLDIALPFYNGYHWCSEIRKVSRVPVMFISSASDSMNIVMAMNMGADDFIAKPFDLTVLSAKVQALLRRTYDFAGGGNTLSARGAVLDLAAGTLDFEGRQLTLTKNELKILQSLLEKHGQVVSRDELMLRPLADGQLRRREHADREYNAPAQKARLHRPRRLHSTRKGLGYAVEQA